MDVQEIQAVVFNILAFLLLLISALSRYEYSTSECMNTQLVMDNEGHIRFVQAGFLGPGARTMQFPSD